jgi:large subunit ribosomal protein L9
VQIKRARSAREIRDLDHANDVKAQLGGIKVVLRTNAGDAGRSFGSVTTTDVAAAIVDAGGPDLDKRSISIATAIKTVGNHTVSIKLHPEVTVEQAITVAAH